MAVCKFSMLHIASRVVLAQNIVRYRKHIENSVTLLIGYNRFDLRGADLRRRRGSNLVDTGLE